MIFFLIEANPTVLSFFIINMNQVPTTLVTSLDAAHCKAIKAEHNRGQTEDT